MPPVLAPVRPMTADEFWVWCSQPGNTNRRCELVDGEIIEMPPPGERHGALLIWIGHLFLMYVIQRGQGTVIGESAVVIQETPDTVRGPDLTVFSEGTPFEQLEPGPSRRIPTLVVEILSPTDRWIDLHRKIDQYLQRGIALVWVIDPDSQEVTVHRLGQPVQIFDSTQTLTGELALPGLNMPVATLFQLPGTTDATTQAN